MADGAADAYFQVLDEGPSGGRYLATEGTAGPWNPGFQHGGPPSALLVRAAERLTESELIRTDLVAVRLAAEFLGPVPVSEVAVSAALVRAARSAALVQVTVAAGDRPCLQGRVWLVRATDTSDVAPPLPSPVDVPRDRPDLGGRFPYHDTIEWQTLTGSMATPGPGRTWARSRIPLVADAPLTGLQRVALIGDSASGISSELDWTHWSFVNIDLDVHLSRPVDGEWVLIDAVTSLGAAGAALTRATVSDHRGEVGCTAQTLILSPAKSLPAQ